MAALQCIDMLPCLLCAGMIPPTLSHARVGCVSTLWLLDSLKGIQ